MRGLELVDQGKGVLLLDRMGDNNAEKFHLDRSPCLIPFAIPKQPESASMPSRLTNPQSEGRPDPPGLVCRQRAPP
jgi:hypothetical protein